MLTPHSVFPGVGKCCNQACLPAKKMPITDINKQSLLEGEEKGFVENKSEYYL